MTEKSASFDRTGEFIWRVQVEVAKWYLKDPASSNYGVTSLKLCPHPDSIGRRAFADDLIEGWRGRWTLEALHCLRAYGRI
jgi:hypothetical protein